MTSMTFGATSSPCTATYIIRRNADEYACTHPRAVEAIKRRHYVDDYLDSLHNEEEIKQLVSDVIMIHKAGGFDIRSWASNNPKVLPLQETSASVSLLQQLEQTHRTLGLNWMPSMDTLRFDLSMKRIDNDIIEGLRSPSKREILKVVMSVFDPLGMLCPFMINGKILMQQIWRSDIKWDQQVDEETYHKWLKWIEKLRKCQTFSVPRCYGFSRMNNLQLHVFVDASEQAYAAVAYIVRYQEIALVMGKCRVAPLKQATISKLELQAAIMGARLGVTVQKEHSIKIEKRTFWTDSKTVWQWINQKPRKQNVFVANRLAEIDELTKPNEWRWLPGSLNVSDEATRSNPAYDMSKSMWISGPDFLRLPEESWPIPEMQVHNEEKNVDRQTTLLTHQPVMPLINYSRFSKWRRLLRCVAYILLFAAKSRHKTERLSPDHEHKAETILLKQVQAECFAEEIAAVRSNNTLKPQSKILRLNPFLNDEGLLCARGRLASGTEIPTSLKTPIILDAKHYVLKLIIQHKHRQLGHHGTATLVNEIRQKYYILRLRQEVRSVIAKCVTCRVRRARCEQPMMAELPQMRLQHHCRPFSYCEIDLFGPMTVTVGRRNEKRWGVIFTCLSVRAVHIELASSLSTDSTIMAIRRMAARRGMPRQIHSDNGTNFKSADKELQKAVRDVLGDCQLIERVTDLGIYWTCNPPEAPHMGGVWERLVCSIKTALAAILFCRTPKEEILITLLAEADNIVNSRPLISVSLDVNEEESLTPNHFLIGSSSGMPSPGIFSF